MVRRLALLLVLAALGANVACAEAVTRTPPAGLDALIGEAKQAMMADPKAALSSARRA